MILGITGHRPSVLKFSYDIQSKDWNNIRTQLTDIFLKFQPEHIISGMALGVDFLAVDVALNNNIPFLAAVPFVGQESVWPKSSQDQYREYLEKAKEVVVVSEGGYSPSKLNIRNEYIVNNSDILIAVWNGNQSGGTYNCISYARSVGKDIIKVTP